MSKEELIALLADFILDNHLSEVGNELKELLMERLGDKFPVRECPQCYDVYTGGGTCRLCETAVCHDCMVGTQGACKVCIENYVADEETAVIEGVS